MHKNKKENHTTFTILFKNVKKALTEKRFSAIINLVSTKNNFFLNEILCKSLKMMFFAFS